MKTLKDWRSYVLQNNSSAEVFYNQIKEEAIKWVKEHKKEAKRHKNFCGVREAYYLGKAKGLIEFFNITEEDLKSEVGK